MKASESERGQWSIRLAGWVFVFGLLTGCAGPNVQPLADAAGPLRQQLVATADIVAADLQQATGPAAPGEGDVVDRLQQLWQVRIAAATALAEYGTALGDLAEAGRHGGETVRDLAARLEHLLNAIGGPTMPGNYVDLAASLYGCVARVRAANQLAEALAAADPAVQAIALVLREDLADLDAILAAAGPEIERRLRAPHAALLSHRLQLERRRAALEATLSDLISRGESVADAPARAELAHVHALIESTQNRYEPLMARIATMHDRVADHRHKLTDARRAIATWAQAHHELATIGQVRAVTQAALVAPNP